MGVSDCLPHRHRLLHRHGLRRFKPAAVRRLVPAARADDHRRVPAADRVRDPVGRDRAPLADDDVGRVGPEPLRERQRPEGAPDAVNTRDEVGGISRGRHPYVPERPSHAHVDDAGARRRRAVAARPARRRPAAVHRDGETGDARPLLPDDGNLHERLRDGDRECVRPVLAREDDGARGGAGKLGGAAAAGAGAAATGAAAVATGPGVSWSRSAASATATTPAESASSATVSRTGIAR